MAPCSCPSSVLCHLPFLLLLLLLQLLHRGSTEKFFVIGPSDPIVAVLGKDVTLSCFLDPVMNAENMELRWFRSNFLETVFIYQDQQENNEELIAQYAGRTSLMEELLREGEAAVTIHKIQASDNGLYTCSFRDGIFYEQASLEVKVTGVGSAPQVYITGQEEDGVCVVCMVSGWFPKPQVQWRDTNGEKLLALSEAQAQDPDGLFSVEVTLVVRDRSSGKVTCSVYNPILDQEKIMAMLIPEPFFPRASPWKLAFLVSLTLLLLLLLGVACYARREHSTEMQELQEQRSLCWAKEEDRQIKEEALKDRDALQAMLDQRKAAYLAAWRKAQLYADWRKEQFRAWSVTVDPVSASREIMLSLDKKTLSWSHDGIQGGYSALGLEGITSGRCYWEVEIRNGDKSNWDLGVWREKKGMRYKNPRPSNGFWVVGMRKKGFKVFTDTNIFLQVRQVPHRVGVFLDYAQGDVSFYDMTDGSHIFSFINNSFSGTLFPYFICYLGDMSMTLCPLEAGSQKPSGATSDLSSLEESVDPSGKGFLSGSGVAGALPGPEAPLLPYTPKTMSP